MNYYQQLGVNDCGPACLAMVASHYKRYVSIGDARKLCKTDAMGTNLAGLVAGAEKLGFNAKAFKGERADKTLDEKLLFPFIAHIKIAYLDRMYDHFVVITSISKTGIEIWDPNPAEGRHGEVPQMIMQRQKLCPISIRLTTLWELL
jgi:ATP-binding cassette subfamily B protein